MPYPLKMAVGLSAKSFGIRLNALMMVGVHTYLGSDCGSNPALWMIPNFVHCMNCLPRELHCSTDFSPKA